MQHLPVIRHFIAVRSRHLAERILAGRQLLDIVRFFRRCPGLHDLPGFVQDRQLRARNYVDFKVEIK